MIVMTHVHTSRACRKPGRKRKVTKTEKNHREGVQARETAREKAKESARERASAGERARERQRARERETFELGRTLPKSP
jgi:hypothetical protein